MPTVTSENKAEFDRQFMEKKNGGKKTCPKCGANRSDIKVLNEDEMIERHKNALKNYHRGDDYEAFKTNKNIPAMVKEEVFSNINEGNQSYCGMTDDGKHYVYHRQPVPSYRRKR